MILRFGTTLQAFKEPLAAMASTAPQEHLAGLATKDHQGLVEQTARTALTAQTETKAL